MKKYKYVPSPVWKEWGSVLEHSEWKEDIKRFFKIAENPNPNDIDEKYLKFNVEKGNWELVFEYWQHNFDAPYAPVILAKFLDECGIDFMENWINPNKGYFLDGEIVEVD